MKDFLEGGKGTFDGVTRLVLDEADRMRDTGLEPQIRTSEILTNPYSVWRCFVLVCFHCHVAEGGAETVKLYS